MVLETITHYLDGDITYYLPYFIGIVVLFSIRKYSAGFISKAERNLNNKTFILVGGLSGPGLELLKSLAIRGAQIITIHSNPTSPSVLQLILLLRYTTSNERIYVDECDIKDLGSIKSFVKRWEKEGRVGMVNDLEARIEGIIFCGEEENEYFESTDARSKRFGGMGKGRIGVGEKEEIEILHQQGLLARFTFIQLLLPNLIKSSNHSTVRIIQDVSPFYSAINSLDLNDLNYLSRKYPKFQPWLVEGQISLASISLLRELQFRLNESKSKKIDSIGGGIIILSVCPGFTRSWVRKTLRANSLFDSDSTWIGLLIYTLLYPLIYLLTKSAEEASQGMLACVLGNVNKVEVPTVLVEVEESEEELKLRRGKEKKLKEESEDDLPMIKLRGGMVYREGREVRIVPLEEAGPKLGSDLWKIESKTIEIVLAKVAEEEIKLEKQKEDLRREKLLNKNKEKEKES